MARGRSFQSYLTAMARASARQAREHQRAIAREQRELVRATKQTARELAQYEKDLKQRYLELRMQEASDSCEAMTRVLGELKNILEETLRKHDRIEFDSLRVDEPYVPLHIPEALTRILPPPIRETYLRRVNPPTFFEKMFRKEDRYQKELADAEATFRTAVYDHDRAETERLAKLLTRQAEDIFARQAHEARLRELNAGIDDLKARYEQGELDAVITYNAMVLECSVYPEGFPPNFRLAYQPDSKELVIDYQFPEGSIVPTETEFKYIKSRDDIEIKARKPADIKAIYQDVIAALTLRTIHEVIEADQGENLQVITFSGYVDTVDPATGLDVIKYLVSVRTTKAEFLQFNLARIDKLVCLRNMGARVSPHPLEQQAVKPVVEFNMVDRRFVEQGDILGELESRPNLMELLPSEFEVLTSNLFSKMGLETKLTRTSRDGGVDVVAFDLRPILGGKVVIQSKRYRHVVGVSAVRDLYGTMQHEGANKGILVTTSNYGPDAYAFVKDKPIELIDGGGLLQLLNGVGIQARIVMPQGELDTSRTW